MLTLAIKYASNKITPAFTSSSMIHPILLGLHLHFRTIAAAQVQRVLVQRHDVKIFYDVGVFELKSEAIPVHRPFPLPARLVAGHREVVVAVENHALVA